MRQAPMMIVAIASHAMVMRAKIIWSCVTGPSAFSSQRSALDLSNDAVPAPNVQAARPGLPRDASR
jgi:hypothetical protein